MSIPVISVRNLGKHYQLGGAGHNTLRDQLTYTAQSIWNRIRHKGSTATSANDKSPSEFWALKDVSFDVQQGEVVGIVGRNGAGKSTLLKVLSQITEPTEGEVRMRGRVASLLEVGTGFHPELSGRENIFLNGAILGMSQAEIRRKFDEIVAFAEVEKFLDTPVKHYSSGMYVRLAFAVASHLEPEILVVDEVLAVGDAQFQKKCIGKMQDVASSEGRTILFVSHSMAAVLNLCKRGIHLESGKKMMDTDAHSAVNNYIQSLEQAARVNLQERTDRKGNGALRFVSFELKDRYGQSITRVRSGQDVIIALRFIGSTTDILKNVHVALGVHGRHDENLFHLSTRNQGSDFAELPSRGVINCTIPHLPLQPGRYSFNIYCTINGDIADWVRNGGMIDVESGDFFGTGQLPPLNQGHFLVGHSWHTETEGIYEK